MTNTSGDVLEKLPLCGKVQLGLHYLDDFILMVSGQQAAEFQKNTLVTVFSRLGVPLEESKLEGPSACQALVVDTIALQLCIPRKKLSKLKYQLERAICHQLVPKEDLECLTGLLQFAK